MMVSEKYRVLYTPIAKCACTSLKTMMVQLEDIKHARKILKLGVHRVTDKFNTGMHLKDLPKERVLEIRTSDEYYKFAVIRDPVKRIISAYTEKFVVNRRNEPNHLHTRPTVRVIQQLDTPDMDRSVTFRQFVEHITAQEPADLDVHWTPQHICLRGVPRYNRIYRVEQLNELKATLENWTGVNVNLGKLNASTNTASRESDPGAREFVDLLPAQLEAHGKLSSAMFMEPELVRMLEDYYAEDCTLYQAASTENTSA